MVVLTVTVLAPAVLDGEVNRRDLSLSLVTVTSAPSTKTLALVRLAPSTVTSWPPAVEPIEGLRFVILGKFVLQ